MFRKTEDFARNWEYEVGATQRILEVLTDESLQQKVSPDGRTLGQIAWHMVTSIQQLMSQAEIKFHSPKIDDDVPDKVEEIRNRYRQVTDSFIQVLMTQWDDESLKKFSNLFGTDLPNGAILMLLLQHQTHHRGQISVLMRQAGLRVPGIYGPSREEWAKLGKDAPR